MRATIVAVLMLVLAPPGLAGKRPPTLRVVDTSPLTVRGAAFPARDAVVVRVREDGRTLARRSVRASTTGAFAMTFGVAAGHRCGGETIITAVSVSGAVAKTKLPQPACPPPLRSP
jgi:hypothetical protein